MIKPFRYKPKGFCLFGFWELEYNKILSENSCFIVNEIAKSVATKVIDPKIIILINDSK